MLAKSALPALDMYCRKANTRSLRKLAYSLGAGLGTNKTSLRSNIMNQAISLNELRQRQLDQGKISVTSIDLGISNFAYAKFEMTLGEELPKLLEWNKFQLEEEFLKSKFKERMSLHPTDTSEVVYNLCEYLTARKKLPDMFTIERQRSRSMSSRSILEPILKVNILEQILFSNLLNKSRYSQKGALNYMVASSDPQRMTSYWNSVMPLKDSIKRSYSKAEEEETKTNGLSNRISKTTKIVTVKKILEGALGIGDYKYISLSPDWSKRLESFIPGNPKFKLYDCAPLGPTSGMKKDDDLADSFLHGLAWIEWLKFYGQIREIVMRKEGKYDQTVLAAFNDTIKSNKLDVNNLNDAQTTIHHKRISS